MDKLSKPVFNDEEYKALIRIVSYSKMYLNSLKDKQWILNKQLEDDVNLISDCLQASEYVNENRTEEPTIKDKIDSGEYKIVDYDINDEQPY